MEGRQQGNCISSDAGGVWCYVDNGATSSCRDLRQSSRFPNNPWSYEACTSPPAPSPACPDPICRGTNCPTQPLCRHLGNCGPSLPVQQQPGIQPIHLPILGAITGAILGALGGAHHQQQQQPTTTLTPPPPGTTTTTPPAATASSITTAAPAAPPPTTTTTSTTSITTTQAPDPWLTQITINPPSNLVQGVWGPMELCPTSTYATDFELLVAPLCDRRCMLDDDVGLMGVRLRCSTVPTPAASSSVVAMGTSAVTANITRVGGGSVLGYSWSPVNSCPRSAFLSGARLLSEFFILETTQIAGVPNPPGCPAGAICRPPSVANSDPAGGMGIDMSCNDGSALSGPGIPEQADISSWGAERVCPSGSALCGIRTKIFEGQSDNVSNLGLTDLMLQCCQLPSFISPPAPQAAPNRAPGKPAGSGIQF